jgi:hypothetical protein
LLEFVELKHSITIIIGSIEHLFNQLSEVIAAHVWCAFEGKLFVAQIILNRGQRLHDLL